MSLFCLIGRSDTECHIFPPEERAEKKTRIKAEPEDQEETFQGIRCGCILCSNLYFKALLDKTWILEMCGRCYDVLLRCDGSSEMRRSERRTAKKTRNPSRSKRRPVQDLHLVRISVSDTSYCRKAQRLPRRQLRQGHAGRSRIRHKWTSYEENAWIAKRQKNGTTQRSCLKVVPLRSWPSLSLCR